MSRIVMPSHNPAGLLTYKLVDRWPSFTCPGLYPDQQFDQIHEDWNSCWNCSQSAMDPVHHLKTKYSLGIPTWHYG
jgi:hypothetical protein